MSIFTSLYKKNGDLLLLGNNTLELLMNDINIKIISNGGYHLMIYIHSHRYKCINNGKLFVYGNNDHGQLGLSDDVYRKEPTLLMDDININMVCCGIRHTLIYRNDGDLLVFGDNNSGQLGLGNIKYSSIPILLMNDKNIKSIHCGGYYSMIYKHSGDLFVFGLNHCGQLGLGDDRNIFVPTLLMNNMDIKNIYCGLHHSMIHVNNKVFVFGNNHHGQLGLNDIINRYQPTLLSLDGEIKAIHCSGYHSIIHKNDNLFVFGYNCHGQLGLNDNVSRKIPTLLSFDANNIKMISGQLFYSIIYKNNGDLFGFGFNIDIYINLDNDKSINKYPLIMSDPSIIKINNQSVSFEWSPLNHKYFSDSFQIEVLILYKCLKKIQLLSGLKIPRFVIYEIIKFL